MTNLENIYTENQNFVFTSFKNKYEKDKEIAADLAYLITKTIEELHETDFNFYRKAKYEINEKIKEIENYQKENKHLTLNEALILGTKEFSSIEAQELVKTISTVKGHIEFNKFLLMETENLLDKEEIIETNKNPDFTTARQVLAIHYMLDELKSNNGTDKTDIARFIQFLTGKEIGVANIANTTIYKKVKSPFSKNEKTLEKDLQYIRIHFEKLGLQGIVSKINAEIGSKE